MAPTHCKTSFPTSRVLALVDCGVGGLSLMQGSRWEEPSPSFDWTSWRVGLRIQQISFSIASCWEPEFASDISQVRIRWLLGIYSLHESQKQFVALRLQLAGCRAGWGTQRQGRGWRRRTLPTSPGTPPSSPEMSVWKQLSDYLSPLIISCEDCVGLLHRADGEVPWWQNGTRGDNGYYHHGGLKMID